MSSEAFVLKTELHYYFADKAKHSMNALSRNENEKDVLKIFHEVSRLLDIDVKIESEAIQAGGLRNRWRVIGEAAGPLILLTSVVSAVITNYNNPYQRQALKSDKDRLRADQNKQTGKKAKAAAGTSVYDSLKTVKDEIGNASPDEIAKAAENCALIIDKEFVVIYHKSNFYKRTNVQDVTRISTTVYDGQSRPIGAERFVEKNDFVKFVLTSNKIEPDKDEEAVIELISPVLMKGKYKWKGIYLGSVISFTMSDDDFKQQVLDRDVEFFNGVAIKCILSKSRKIDDGGGMKITGYTVLTVVEIIRDNVTEQTVQGKKQKAAKAAPKQLDLFGF